MENKSLVKNGMACVMREAKAKFKRAIVMEEVEEEEEKLPSTDRMNNVMSQLHTMHKTEKLFPRLYTKTALLMFVPKSKSVY